MSKPEELQSENQALAPRGLFRAIEPATIITVTLGAIYVLGWSYTDSYFERFGIEHKYLDLPTSIYLAESIWAISLIFLLSTFVYITGQKEPTGRREALVGNLAIVIPGIIMLALGAYTYGYFNSYLALLTGGILLLTGLLISWGKISISYFFRHAPPALRTMIYISTIILLIPVVGFIGDYHATRQIEGSPQYVHIVRFILKENILPDIEGKELVLIIYRNGKYYVVQKERPAPIFPRVYVIPDEQIKVAIIGRIN